MKKNKILFVGDFESNTGPAIINKNIKKYMGDKAIYTCAKKKISRVLELILKTLRVEKICFCSLSKLDKFGVKLAKVLGKKTIYLMHGYSKYEQEIKNNINEKKIETEKFIISNVDKILCVSKKFKNFMQKELNEYEFDYVYNGIEWNMKKKECIKNKYQIISSGGGEKQKHNLQICEAIKKINNKEIKYIIVGKRCDDINKILEYDFVEYYETMEQEKYLEMVAKSSLYIQNSLFETFGMAIIEALELKCNVLISANVGVVDLINSIESNDLIFNNDDINEISEKIKENLKNGNNKRIVESIDKDSTSVKNRVNELYYKIMKV